ncbi:MAG: malto-oligosyltrehalose synthase [Candidatus Omnitrophota bacterium]
MKVPTVTYRIQFNPDFGFKSLEQIAAYFFDLGISHIYASPIFKARKGSTHGYDIVDTNQLNPELGCESEFQSLIKVLQNQGMGWIQDIVINHMAFDSANQMLMDVLTYGVNSKYSRVFDIEWNHPAESFKGKVLVPVLGTFYAEALEDGQIQLNYEQAELTVNYYAHKFPLNIESVAYIFKHNLKTLEEKLRTDIADFIKFLGALHLLKDFTAESPNGGEYDQKKHVMDVLWEFYCYNFRIREFIDTNIRLFNGERGRPESFDRLDHLLSQQAYRLSFWKVAAEEINYRRFFNINELISVRVEDEEIFTLIHDLIFKYIGENVFSGLRIDHIDGFYNPTEYQQRLRAHARDVYIVAEKILNYQESIPFNWPIEGTTGYDFLNYVNGLFCNQENENVFTKIYNKFCTNNLPFDELVSDKKRLIIGRHMAGDIDNLAQFIKNISAKDRYGRDITLYGLRRALVEVMTFFPVYRTYITGEPVNEIDKRYITEAVQKACEKYPGLLHEFKFIEKFLLLKYPNSLSEEEKKQWGHFVMKFQQYTGPLMAKGFEDTLLYIYNRLISLNEVGGSPERFGFTRREFHDFCKARGKNFPNTLNATATHDTKRGEDTRARINVLSELPKEWEERLKHWSKLNKHNKKQVREIIAPDANDEYFLYQTLIGTFPFDQAKMDRYKKRIKQYLIKAIREAKRHTAWLKPDQEYEDACLSFVEAILKTDRKNDFLTDFLPFEKKIADYAIFNSLAQVLIKITAPGAPDFYQGTELWDFSLVDPDNRRPVDFTKRIDFLKQIREESEKDVLRLISELLAKKEDGRIKLFLVYQALKARNKGRDIFQKGEYFPLSIEGTYKYNIIAFARRYENNWAISVVPRFLTGIIKEGEVPFSTVWRDTQIILPEDAPKNWQDIFTNQKITAERAISISETFKHFPASLLINREKFI